MNTSRLPFSRALFRHPPKSTKLSGRRFSTQKTTKSFLNSGKFGNIAPFIIGFPAGWYAYDYVHPPESSPHPHDFYEGSLDWKGKAVKPFTITDANLWLRKEQSSHKGPPGSGVKSWDIVRCPSNAICEDNLVTAQCAIPRATKPWLFWGVFDGHV
jgi:hypothetical protein